MMGATAPTYLILRSNEESVDTNISTTSIQADYRIPMVLVFLPVAHQYVAKNESHYIFITTQ